VTPALRRLRRRLFGRRSLARLTAPEADLAAWPGYVPGWTAALPDLPDDLGELVNPPGGRYAPTRSPRKPRVRVRALSVRR